MYCSGVHKTKSAGYRNLNEELALPLKQVLANMWERAFSNRIPDALALFPVASRDFIDSFHQSVKGRILPKDHGILQRSLQQNVNYDDIFEEFKNSMYTAQQEANRAFTPTIRAHMEEAYEACRARKGKKTQTSPIIDVAKQLIGKNVLLAMEGIMKEHVSETQGRMFHEATRDVHIQLNDICENLEFELRQQIVQSISDITFDFESGIIGSNLVQASKAARTDVYGILSTTDALFNTREDDPTGSASLP